MFFKLKNLSYLQVLSSFFFFILIFFFFFIHFSGKCDLKEFRLISKSFNFKTAYNNCEQSITNAVKYRLISKISGEKISDSDFKISFDEFVLKKDESKIQKKPNIKKGLINNIDNYLIDIEKDYFLKNNFTSWTRSHGGYSNIKFSASNQITSSTAKRLKLFWKYDGDFNKKNWKINVETNPIFYDGIIYSVTADHKLIALDVLNKKLKWQIQSPKVIAKRGFLIDTKDKSSPQIFTPIGKKIFKINAKDGKINKTFGINGSINFFTLVAPFIFNEKVCAAGLRKINCFDKTSGKEIFSINLHNKDDSGGNVWGGVAFDNNTGYAYVVTGNPRPALIGVNRIEKNKNANSIIAVSLNEKKIVWKFQDILHDLWDYDIAHPPIISNLKFGDKFFPAVITVGKTGNVIILNRYNGKNLFDIDYKKVEKSKIPFENSSQYQINIKSPKRLIELDDIKNRIYKYSDKLDDSIKYDLENSNFGEFKPPKYGQNTIILGLHGGATWPGSSFNPIDFNLFTPINMIPFVLRIDGKTKSLIEPKSEALTIYKNLCSNCHGKYRNGTSNPELNKDVEILNDYNPSLVGISLFNKKHFNNILNYENFKAKHPDTKLSNSQLEQLKKLFINWDNKIIKDKPIYMKGFWYKYLDKKNKPIYPPPWGKIVSTNVKTGEINWEKNLGDVKFKNQTLKGSIMYGGLASNKGGIIVATGTTDNKVYVLDQKNGNELWSYTMESAGSSPPIIFTINDKEFIGIVSTGGLFNEFNNKGSNFYFFSLQ